MDSRGLTSSQNISVPIKKVKVKQHGNRSAKAAQGRLEGVASDGGGGTFNPGGYSDDGGIYDLTGALPTLNESRCKKEFYLAEIARMQCEEQKKDLIKVEEVKKYLGLVGTKLRSSLTNLPDRLAPRLAPESDEETVHAIMLEEVQAITRDLDVEMDNEFTKTS